MRSLKYFLSVFLLPIVFFTTYVRENYSYIAAICERGGDFALIALNVEKAKLLHAFTGPYSRFRFQHPGPVSYYYYAAAEYLFPGAANDQARYMLSALLLNALLLLVTLAIAYRHAVYRWLTPVLFVLVLISFRTVGRPFLYNIWNPVSILFPMLCFLVTASAYAMGQRVYFFGMVLSGIFVFHNYLAGALTVLPLAFISIYLCEKNRRSDQWYPAALERVSLFAGIGALVLTSLLPLSEIISSPGGGNLGRIFEYISSSHSSHRFHEALDYVSRFYSAPLRAAIGAPPLLVLLVLVIIPFGGKREKGSFEWNLRTLLTVGAVLSIVLAEQIEGKYFGYLMWYLYAFSALQIYLCCSVFVSVGEPFVARRIPPAASYIFLLAFLSLFVTKLAQSYTTPSQPCKGFYQTIMDKIGQNKGALYRIQIADGERWDVASAIVLRLYREGRHFCVAREWSFMFGEDLACKSGETSERGVVDLTFGTPSKENRSGLTIGLM